MKKNILYNLLYLAALLLNIFTLKDSPWKAGIIAVSTTVFTYYFLKSHWFFIRNWVPMEKAGYKLGDFGFRRMIYSSKYIEIHRRGDGQTNVYFEDDDEDPSQIRLVAELDLGKNQKLLPVMVQLEKSERFEKATGIPLYQRLNYMNDKLRDLVIGGPAK